MGMQARPVRKKRWLLWTIELLIIIGIVLGIRGWQQRSLVAGTAPAFDEITLSGDELTLASYQGKPVMLHFWASWCSVCEVEQDVISKVKAAGWPVITVAYASGESEEVERYMQRKGIEDWTTVVDHDGDIARQYGVIGVPTSYIIDPEGQIRFSEIGLTSSWGLRLRLWLADKLGK